jgi:hypothetical protein
VDSSRSFPVPCQIQPKSSLSSHANLDSIAVCFAVGLAFHAGYRCLGKQDHRFIVGRICVLEEDSSSPTAIVAFSPVRSCSSHLLCRCALCLLYSLEVCGIAAVLPLFGPPCLSIVYAAIQISTDWFFYFLTLLG